MHRSLALVTLFIIALAGPLAARGAPSRGPGLAPKYESLGWHREPAFAVGIGGAAWDGARNEGIAYGANDATITWRWNGSQWAPVAAAAGTLSLDPQLVYDAARRVIVQRSRLSDETWLWDGNVWTQVKPAHSPGVRRSLAMAYDEARQRVVMLGSGDNETWLWDGSDWSKAAAPGARPGPYDVPRLAYDAARQRVVLHGAANAFSPIETWLWNGTQWAKANPSTSPDDRYNGPLAYDAARQRVVLPTVGADLEFATWLWDGTNWTKANPVHHPSSRNAAALFYDSAQSRLLLVGGYGTVDSQTLSDTWAWDGSDWTLRLDDLHPSPTTGAAFAYDEVRGDALLYGGTPGATSIAETWRLVGSS